ncbi:hypothetical protein SFLOR_v1c05950 [Spiroplasma floricola 23-6]|uniref:Uncharacterized protein n=1 Tax=Spiroplasma floricola 23-6 TaxID=1336749 RepID=A0A2K8SDW1_9MOLU|nr:hypothetical protein SFLOR_v1c05950 [Spiroplasma floricola 23-6]
MMKKNYKYIILWNIMIFSFAIASIKLFIIFNIFNIFLIYSMVYIIGLSYFKNYYKLIKNINVNSKFKDVESYNFLKLMSFSALTFSFLTQAYNSIFITDLTESFLRFNSYSISFILFITLLNYFIFIFFLISLKLIFNLIKKINIKISYLFKKYLKKVNYILIISLYQKKIYSIFSLFSVFLIKIKFSQINRNVKIYKSILWVDKYNKLLIL